MKKLSNEVRDRVIVFFGKGHKIISSAQEQVFFEESNSSAKGIVIDGDFVNFSAVAKVISINEFYNENPDLRPNRPEMLRNFVNYDLGIRRFEKYDTTALELMREGVSRHARGVGTGGAQDVLEKMDKRIAELKRLKQEEDSKDSKH